MEDGYPVPALELVEGVFTRHENAEGGNPLNYRHRGFVTSADHGNVASDKIGLPIVECMMVKKLVPGALDRIKGTVDYSFYEVLR